MLHEKVKKRSKGKIHYNFHIVSWVHWCMYLCYVALSEYRSRKQSSSTKFYAFPKGFSLMMYLMKSKETFSVLSTFIVKVLQSHLEATVIQI